MNLRRLVLGIALLCALPALDVRDARAVTTDTAEYRFVAKAVDLVNGTTGTIIPATARKWRTTWIDVHVKTVTGFVAVASISIGSNSANFNNVMAIAALGTASTVDSLVAQTSLVILPAAVDLTTSGLQFKITTPAVATTMTVDVHVKGHFLEP
jgi:hypothetical protein